MQIQVWQMGLTRQDCSAGLEQRRTDVAAFPIVEPFVQSQEAERSVVFPGRREKARTPETRPVCLPQTWAKESPSGQAGSQEAQLRLRVNLQFQVSIFSR